MHFAFSSLWYHLSSGLLRVQSGGVRKPLTTPLTYSKNRGVFSQVTHDTMKCLRYHWKQRFPIIPNLRGCPSEKIRTDRTRACFIIGKLNKCSFRQKIILQVLFLAQTVVLSMVVVRLFRSGLICSALLASICVPAMVSSSEGTSDAETVARTQIEDKNALQIRPERKRRNYNHNNINNNIFSDFILQTTRSR